MKKYRVVEAKSGLFYTQVLGTKRCGFLWLKHKPDWKYLWYENQTGLHLTLDGSKNEIAQLIKNDKKFANGDIIHDIN
jgi:hypothetical protein